MEKIMGIPVADMKGYRKPSARENDKILKKIMKELNLKKVWLRMISILAGYMIAAFLFSMISSLKNSIESPAGLIFNGIFLIIFAAVFIFIQQNSARNKILRSRFLNGNYEVMECIPYETDTDLYNASKGRIRIQNQVGNVCMESFIFGIKTVREYEQNPECKLLLVFQRECEYRRLLTAKDIE